VRRESHAQFYERPVASAGLLTHPSRLSERSDVLPAKAIGIIPSFNFHGRLCEIREVRNRLQFSAALGLQANCPAVFSDEAIRQERDNWNRDTI
jgi:hypothetical protein